MSTNFGRILKQIREERGFTLKQAAGTAISPNNLSKFEKGETIVRADTFFKIFENLNIFTTDTHQKSILDKSIFCEQSSSGILFPNFESLFLTSK